MAEEVALTEQFNQNLNLKEQKKDLEEEDFHVLLKDETADIEKSSKSEETELTALQRHRHRVTEYLRLHHEAVPEFQDVSLLSGHVNNLSPVEEVKLQLLWTLLLAVLSSPGDADLADFDRRSQKHKLAYCKALFARLHPLLPSDCFDVNGQEGSQADFYLFKLDEKKLYVQFYKCETFSQLMDRVDSNPISQEFYDQMGAEDPDTLLLRFLRARKWNIIDASLMLIDTLYWHRSFGVGRLMREGEPAVFQYLLTCNKHYAWNVDHKGRLVIWITSRLHDKNRQTLQQNLEALVYLVEQARRLMAPGTETVSLVFDLADAPLSSLDLPSIQGDIHVLQNYYPECLGTCYIVDAPWIFHGVYRMVKGFLDPVVVSKINLLKSSEIIKFVHPSMVPKRYAGGCDPVEYLHSIDPESGSKRINPVPDLAALESQLSSLRRQVIQMSLEMKASDAFDAEGLRASLRTDLRELAMRWECAVMPPTHHHRCGVLSPEGKVDWNQKRDL